MEDTRGGNTRKIEENLAACSDSVGMMIQYKTRFAFDLDTGEMTALLISLI